MSEILLPCPFCGEKPTMSTGRPFVVHCEMCGCETSTFNNADLCANRWNTRVGHAPTRLWPKVFNVKRAYNTWNGEIAFAREPTDDELKAIEVHLRDDHRPAPTAAEFEGPTLTEEVAQLRKIVAESGGLRSVEDDRSTASNAEPVAWLVDWEEGGGHVRQPYMSKDDAERVKRNVIAYRKDAPQPVGITPLYAIPPSSGNADAAREQIARIIDPQIGNLPHINLFSIRFQRVYEKTDAILAALSSAPVSGEWQTEVKEIVDLYFAPWGAAKGARWEALSGDQPFNAESALSLIEDAITRNDRSTPEAK